MQSSGTPYQGSAPHGQYTDHTYDNPMGIHCQQSGYQSYMNGPYPVASPRPPPLPHHHYSGHQVPYRGNYPPPSQNQYAPMPPNQDMYRNHHSAYVGTGHNSNRNMPVKPVWGENNASEMMPVYNHVSPRPPMMSNSPAMNVSSMRSPPHLSANINPVPSPGPQHYRQMQSPGHSPQTWPQAQVPSPVMHHAARATPSPLPSHARSPGHSQPFSPPSAATHITGMPTNITSHNVNPVLPENCQPPPMVNQQVPNKNANDPLHSLQKMVMLDQSADQMQMNCHLPNDNCDQLTVHRSNQMISQQNVSDESKDSTYATYFNLDENRLESEPQSEPPKPSGFIHGSSNDYVTDSPHLLNNDMPPDSGQPMKNLHMLNPASNDTYLAMEQSHIITPQASVADLPQTAVSVPSGPPTHIPDSVPKTTEPCLGNSAPCITSSQVAIPSSTSMSESVGAFTQPESSCTEGVNPPSNEALKENMIEDASVAVKIENCEVKQCNDESKENCVDSSNLKTINAESDLNSAEPEVVKPSTNNVNSDAKPIPSLSTSEKEKGKPSIVKLSALKSVESDNSQLQDIKPIIEDVICQMLDMERQSLKDSDLDIEVKPVVKTEVASEVQSFEMNSDDVQALPNGNEIEVIESAKVSKAVNIVQATRTSNLSNSVKSKIISSQISRNPVKVVIHRIRTNSTNDTWHVPKTKGNVSSVIRNRNLNSAKSKLGSRSPGAGPQIIILSPAMARKKANLNSNSPEKATSSTSEKTTVVANNRTAVNKSLASKLGAGNARRRRMTTRGSSSESPLSSPQKKAPPKRRGRPFSGKVKEKAPAKKRKGKMKKNIRNKKMKIETMEVAPKVKKVKPFNGPYIHLTGPKQKPSSITVVNMALKEEEKGKLSRGKSETVMPKRPRVGHTSTLSPHYDAFNKDRTWLCTFCHKGSHCSGLGDLYGPYYTKSDDANVKKNSSANSCKDTPTTHSATRGIRSKRRKSDGSLVEHEKSTSKKLKLSNKTEQSSTSEASASTQGEQEPTSDAAAAMKEVWIHEDCAVWCQSISLMGSQIHGLDEAIQESKENVCSSCKLTGATLGCWCKGCKEQYHFSCAKEKACQLDIENFSLFCPKHKLKRSQSNSQRTVKKTSECKH